MTTDPARDDQRVRTVCLLILTLIAVGVALSLLRPVLVPFCLAVMLTYCLTPVIDWQMKYLRLPRSLALLGVVVIGVLLSLFLAYVTAAAVGEIAAHISEYRDRIRALTERARRFLPLSWLGIAPAEGAERVLTLTESSGKRLLGSLLSGLTDLVSTGVLVAIFLAFILLGRRSTPRDPTSLLGEIEERVRLYLVRLVGLSALTGVLVGSVLAVLGVPFALVFGFLAFLLNFIPNIGAVVATLLPLPLVLIDAHFTVTQQVLTVVLPGAIQVFIGSLIQPRFFGAALDLHPVTVLMALIFFGMIWGVVGAFLAMPLTGVIRIVLGRIPTTQPLAALMAGDLDLLNRPGKAASSGPEP